MGEKKIDAKNNFGKKGWIVIIYSMFALFLNTGATVDGANATVQVFSQAYGWDPNTLLYFATIAGLCSLVGIALFGSICQKIGPRKVMFISGFLGGLSYIWYAHSTTLTTYLIAFCLVNMFTIGSSWVGAAALCTNWFPRKKGLVMGWVTMGNNFSTAFFIAMITGAMSAWGLANGLSIVGYLFILSAILALFMKDYPEQAGCYPDNIKPEEGEEVRAADIDGTLESTITIKDVFSRKEVWLVTLSCGILAMCTVGVVSQLVPRIMGLGYSQGFALSTMTVCALIGVVGSYVVGFWDQKFGTKRALLMFAVVFACGLILNVIPSKPTFYLSLLVFGFSLGGTANFPVSFTACLFGRRDFNKAFTIVNLVQVAIRMLGFSALALFTQLTGSVGGAYVCFAVLIVIAGLIASLVNVEKYQEKYPLQN